MPTLPSDAILAERAPLLPVDATGIVAHQAPDFFALWEGWEREAGEECPIPFWGAIWPGDRFLARTLLNERSLVAGRSVLDFGAGGAVAAIAAAQAGASRVVANDIDPVAHHLARKNCAANSVGIEHDATDLLSDPACAVFDIILVADMFYERSTAGPLLRFLSGMRERGAEILIADGSRPFAPKTGVTVLDTGSFSVNHPLEGCAERTVTLYRLEN